eukprot:jgi/Psemu1/58869/gm1.58869_g
MSKVTHRWRCGIGWKGPKENIKSRIEERDRGGERDDERDDRRNVPKEEQTAVWNVVNKATIVG